MSAARRRGLNEWWAVQRLADGLVYPGTLARTRSGAIWRHNEAARRYAPAAGSIIPRADYDQGRRRGEVRAVRVRIVTEVGE